jgi:hypothetical protein
VKRHGRPILGAISGFFLGLFVALDLVLFGAVRLDSVIITILPLAGLVFVPIVAWLAPIGSRSGA